MKIAVIGGNGFIGSHFVAGAVDRGHQVIVFEPSSCSPCYSHGRPYNLVTGGVRALIDDFSSYENVDVICHFASSTIPSTSNVDPVRDIEENLVQLVQLLDVMKNSRCRRIVFLSSGGAIYGTPRYVPMDEEHPQRPLSSYGIVKVAIERYLELYANGGGIRPAIVRPSNPFGPGQNPNGQIGVISSFLNCAMLGTPVKLYGDGSIIRDFIFVTDLIDLLLKIVERDVIGTFNCGRGVGVSLAKLLDMITDVTGCKLLRHYEPARSFDPPSVILDIARANKELGWSPTTPLLDGIRRTWNCLCAFADKNS